MKAFENAAVFGLVPVPPMSCSTYYDGPGMIDAFHDGPDAFRSKPVTKRLVTKEELAYLREQLKKCSTGYFT